MRQLIIFSLLSIVMAFPSKIMAIDENNLQLFQNLSDREKQALMRQYGDQGGMSLNQTPPPMTDSVRKIYLPQQGYVLPEDDYEAFKQSLSDNNRNSGQKRYRNESDADLGRFEYERGSFPSGQRSGLQGQRPSTDSRRENLPQAYQSMDRRDLDKEQFQSHQNRNQKDETIDQSEETLKRENAYTQLTQSELESHLSEAFNLPDQPLFSSQNALNQLLERKFQTGQLNEVVLPYGAQLFAGLPTTFAPVNEIPIPTDYMLGPGDQLKVAVFGQKSESYQLVVDREGSVVLPKIGPVTLAGLQFSEAKARILKELQSLGVGVSASVTMGEMRSFRVFVLGESRTPGSYLVSGMATLSHALYVSGGISQSGSYRNIQLLRNGKTIQTLDLYDFLLNGNTSDDVRLQPGDSVFIPKVSDQVTLAGEVQRPGQYELKSEKTLAEALALAGIKSSAQTNSIKLSRVNSDGTRTIHELDFTNPLDQTFAMQSGDEVLIKPASNVIKDQVQLHGQVVRDAQFQWHQDLTLKDILPSQHWFESDADVHNLVIVRQPELGKSVEFLRADWTKADTEADRHNPVLQPRDQVWVLSREDSDRRNLVTAYFDRLISENSGHRTLAQRVSAIGQFKFPGRYPLMEGMKVSDLINFAGGLKAGAATSHAELFRYEIRNGDSKEVERIEFNLQKALAGDPQHNIALTPSDVLTIKQLSNWTDATRTITLEGEVRFPGSYVIEPGDTLQSVLKRAGGFTQWAAPENSVFTREALKEKEKRELEALADEMEKNLLMALKSDAPLLEKDTGATIAQMGQSLVTKIKNTPAIGRLVIGLTPEKEERYQSTLNLEVRDGDSLIVPKRSSEVVVMGEVSRSASMLYQPSLTVEDYLESSGGTTDRADEDAIYIVHGDGSIERYSNGLFDGYSNITLSPGDSIVVPMDIERMNPIFTWTSITKVLSNFAITAATLNTIGAF
ncbi:MAG: SLBB domain-containing protein [Hydrogenovibrio sp.]|uniref:SLBB domain-containing protein n=1 Tax=Hydrogenovibrio sp. TaxID=2065821 RepID=UPI0028701744|nr:SLBB domain-containing protein [Hydrogenovibrio sp.]MDR9499881.1 SLBB domain-containing protein [Hydrogenovibrio sp.]